LYTNEAFFLPIFIEIARSIKQRNSIFVHPLLLLAEEERISDWLPDHQQPINYST